MNKPTLTEHDWILETPRLQLRKLCREDTASLCAILQDETTMYAYEHAFSDDEVIQWLERQFLRYEQDGFGLWAVILKQTGAFIGQTGITLQNWETQRVPEVGYLFNRAYWHQGYATEAAKACKQYAFETLGFQTVYSIIRDTNIASQQVAIRNGMQPVGSMIKYYQNMEMPHIIYAASNSE